MTILCQQLVEEILDHMFFQCPFVFLIFGKQLIVL